jgi:hypothetical protein
MSKPLLSSLQQTACTWQATDYSAAGFAELVWALASMRTAMSYGCEQLLQTGLLPDGDSAEEVQQQQQESGQTEELPLAQQPTAPTLPGTELSRQQHLALQPPQHSQQQAAPSLPARDWDAWFQGTPASQVVMLLWAAARLHCTPCLPCMHAASKALLRPGADLAGLSTKVTSS